MRVAGIIAEYNPFHSGHAWQIEALRKAGFDAVVCVCSPTVVQRGTVALLPAAVRTRAALAGGADLVLCLPSPYATLSAEGFARAGVALLWALGVCEVVAFGAETPQVQVLQRTAQMLDTPQFAEALKLALQGGISFAAARAKAAEVVCCGAEALLRAPNNILAVEYCRALQRPMPESWGAPPQPYALPRMGAQHDAPLHTDGSQGRFASATALRNGVEQCGVETLRPYVPAACFAVYEQAQREGDLLCTKSLEIATLSRLRAMGVADFAAVRGVGEGLEHRLYTALRETATLTELYAAVKSKRYAHARVRRLVLDAVLGVGTGLPIQPPYLQVLGASPTGLLVLNAAKGRSTLPLSHSLRILEQTSAAAGAVARAHAAAEDFAGVCMHIPRPQGAAYTSKMIVTGS